MKRKAFLGTKDTQNRIVTAISDLAKMVQVTLGPGGRPILIENENRPPTSTKDGVTVARAYNTEGNIERVVVNAALEICERTVKEAGDGTTTAIVLGAALVKAGKEFLDNNPSVSPQELSRQLKRIYLEEIKPKIIAQSKQVKNLPIKQSKEILKHVARVSANHDEEIAEVVAKAVEAVGEDGMITAEEGIGIDTKMVHTEGFTFQSGLSQLGPSAGASFVNRTDYGDCVIEMAYVCLYDGEIIDPTTITPLLERIISEVDEQGRPVRTPVLIVAHKFSDMVLKMMAQNFRRGVLSVVPIMTHRNGQNLGPSYFLHDLAAYVGGKVFDSQGSPLAEAQIPQLGVVEKAKIGTHESVFFGKPDQDLLESRIEELKNQMEGVSEFDQEHIRYRIGRLTGGVATIYAGGRTQLEAKERHARVIDAISSVKSAIQMGVVPGGGTTLFEISLDYIDRSPNDLTKIFHCLSSPFFQILDNAGISPLEAAHSVGHQDHGYVVYDALRRGPVEWFSAGIMDPTKVTLTALENALSVAQLLMTCGGVISMEYDAEIEKVRQMQEGMLKAIEGEALG